MKKIWILCGLVIFVATNGNSQVRYGVRGGLNWSFYKAKDIIIEDQDYNILFNKEVRSGYHFGLFTQFKRSGFFLQPEILITANKADVSLMNKSSSALDEHLEQKFFKLDIPVLLGYKLGPLKIEAGPVGTVLLKNSLVDDLKEYVTDYDQTWKQFTLGYQAGLGIDVASLAIDLKYEGSFGTLGESIKIGQQELNFDSRLSQIILSIGLFIDE